MRIRPVNMEFLYGTAFLSQSPEAYERLIMDAMRGDATLFTRNDEVEAQWRDHRPDRRTRGTGQSRAGPLPQYEAGSQGPDEADAPPRRRRRAGARSERRGRPDTVWSARDTTPARHRGGAARAAAERHARERAATSPARVLNLVCVVDARVDAARSPTGCDGVGRYHPSRTIVCAVEPRPHDARRGRDDRRRRSSPKPRRVRAAARDGRRRRAASATSRTWTASSTRSSSPTCPPCVWSPHGHHDARRRAARASPRSCCSTPSTSPTSRDALRRAARASPSAAYVVDLAWLRSTPWRERIAATFDPPHAAPGAAADHARSTIRHHPDSAVAGAAAGRAGWPRGWAGSRSALVARGADAGRARPRAPPPGRAVALEPDAEQDVRGLAGLESRPRRRRRSRSTAAPAACARATSTARGNEPRVDGPRRLARRGGDPRRGHPPGAAARPDLPARRWTRRRDAACR